MAAGRRVRLATPELGHSAKKVIDDRVVLEPFDG